MAVDVQELKVVAFVDDKEISAPDRFEPSPVGLGQRHAGVQAADMAVMVEARV
jgi:hypothetical protein